MSDVRPFFHMKYRDLIKNLKLVEALEAELAECFKIEWLTGKLSRWTPENLDLARATHDRLLAEIALRAADYD